MAPTIIDQMNQKYINERHSVPGYHPLVDRNFSEIVQGRFALNNGWVHGFNSLEDIIKSKEFLYFRRRVHTWGDLIKLRYGDSKENSPKLWNHM